MLVLCDADPCHQYIQSEQRRNLTEQLVVRSVAGKNPITFQTGGTSWLKRRTCRKAEFKYEDTIENETGRISETNAVSYETTLPEQGRVLTG